MESVNLPHERPARAVRAAAVAGIALLALAAVVAILATAMSAQALPDVPEGASLCGQIFGEHGAGAHGNAGSAVSGLASAGGCKGGPFLP